ncbi:MAG: hypothetical protein KDK22_09340, partial [Rhodobacteraceae bacterium]|nr:hypothetical protein [Paracoccaceae bacterium]
TVDPVPAVPLPGTEAPVTDGSQNE